MSNQNKIWLSLAHMGSHEQTFVKSAFDSNWVVPLGPNVDGFETDLQDHLQTNQPIVALSSGTAAIHLALIQLGVGVGDEVIAQSFTFAATANPITYLGATPVFVDSEPNTWNISPFHLEEAIKDRIAKTGKAPKAIIPVHLYGMPAKMDLILEIAHRYNIPVLEDAAEALGSKYMGKSCGTFGNFACLSFNGNKIITTSGGGALVCPNVESANHTKFLATQARDNAPHYQHSQIGYNYRLSNICAGIGRGQMMVLQDRVAARQNNHKFYKQELSKLAGITVNDNPNSNFESNMWLTTIVVDSTKAGFTREELRLKMEQENIETRPLWKPLHLQPVFAASPFYGDGTSEKLFQDGLCLPSGSSLSNEDLTRVVDVIKKLQKAYNK